ncbi:MAG: flagellar basal body rod protein FlgB [Phycisphaerales bacterium]
MISKLFTSGSMQAVERLVEFTGARHKVLASNIANFETPFYRARDLDPETFQASLRDAIDDRRRSRVSPIDGVLKMRDTSQMRFRDSGTEFRPGFADEGIMFHDRTNADVERTMQHLAENTMAHNTGLEILKNQFDLLKTAIRGRV